MSIRKTTVLFVVMAFIGLITVLLVIQDVTVARMFEQVELQDADENMRRAQAVLQGEFEFLEAISGDWAQREDISAFVQTQTAPVDSVLSEAAYEGFGLDVIVVRDPDGQAVFAGAYERDSDALTPLDPALLEQVTAPFFAAGEPNRLLIRRETLPTPGGLLLLVAQGISGPTKAAEPAGAVILGRYLSDAQLQRLTDLIQLRLQVRQLDDPTL
ncbi:MAG TPA: CHASE4 domain-containing protein, partial [Anaerolineaceae bacterium]|nr:CHASE4 domain-containing protein [Anaerolineaceae bacterium]